ncbi:hypothetical protein [Actinospica sp.]|jgi:hypothetical protein|uniref:hypothetical protein n=1 Tax=Actinospica sp. TaxID=1872142 RepID=UPI002BA3AA42|nr:hypothetical protein [Actinospica sp.]HWG25357.1 hypothetical protein [Actinospica sp.]
MARTYLSTLSPRRRWGIAFAAAGVALAATAGLGEPWGYHTISALPKDSGFSSAPLLASTLQVFHWTTGSAQLGGTHPWIAAFVLDLVWPLLILIGTRALAGGLALRRANSSLIVGVWSVTTLTGAFAGLAAGLVDHGAGSRVAFAAVSAHTTTGDVLALQAATIALVGALVGWLPGVAAALAYSVNRVVPQPEPETMSGEEKTLVEETGTLSLENLEELRHARRDDGRLKDAGTSEFFRV